MKILVLGGAGYKGLMLSSKLLGNNNEVTIFDNFMYGYDSSLFLFKYPKVTFIQKDIRNIEEKDVAPYDMIFHLAGISGYPACEANPNSAHTINITATKSLVSLLSKEQILINPSTTSFYGNSGTLCTEESPTTPISLYGITKYESEKICMERENSISFRFATIFGVAPRMRWDLMPNDFVMRAVQERALVLFDSKSVRTFLHIDDAIRSYMMVFDNLGVMKGNVYNVGDESMNFSKMQLAEIIKKYVDFSIIDSTLPDFDGRNFIIQFDKIARLGFTPQKTLEDGIKDLIKFFKFYKPTRPFNVI